MGLPQCDRKRRVAPGVLHLRRFLPHHAEVVAGWVGDDGELFWLAPSTEAPLIARKVLAWTRKRGRPYVMCAGEDQTPIGYAELNPMQQRKDHWWVGHVLLAPPWRGRGYGAAFMRLLLEHAFDDLGAQLVSLIVFPDNRRAIRCYLDAGFTIHDEQYHQFGRFAKTYRMLHLVSTNRAFATAQRSRPVAQLLPDFASG